MKKILTAVFQKLISPLLTAIFIFGFFYLFIELEHVQLSNNPLKSSPTNTPIATLIAPTTPTLTYDNALSTYANIASSSIDASERALNIMVTVFLAIMGLAAVASGLAVYLYKTSSDATKKAQTAEDAAQNAKNSVDRANLQLNNLSEQYLELNKSYIFLLQQSNELREKTLTFDAALQAGDRGEISRERLIEAQQWQSFNKWVNRNNKLGRKELIELASNEPGLLPPIRIAIEMELAKIREKGNNLSQEEKEFMKQLIDLRDIKPNERI